MLSVGRRLTSHCAVTLSTLPHGEQHWQLSPRLLLCLGACTVCEMMGRQERNTEMGKEGRENAKKEIQSYECVLIYFQISILWSGPLGIYFINTSHSNGLSAGVVSHICCL